MCVHGGGGGGGGGVKSQTEFIDWEMMKLRFFSFCYIGLMIIKR